MLKWELQMIGKSPKPPGKAAIKIVRRRLADGSIREYRYGVAEDAPPLSTPIISAIIKAYETSPEWKRLSTGTKLNKRRHHMLIENHLGWMGTAHINDKRARTEFYALRDSLAHKPATSMLLLSSLRSLLFWAERRAMIEHNWARGIEPIYEGGQRADLVWSPDLQKTFLQDCPPPLARAFQFAALSAIRIGDLLALTWSQFDGRWLRFKPQKTRNKNPLLTVSLPIFVLAPLRNLMNELPQGHDQEPIFTMGHNTAYVQRTLHHQFDQRRQQIDGAGHLHWHDLRGTAISTLFAAGCSDAEVASISGHKIGGQSMLGAYAARSDELPINAFRKLDTYLMKEPTVVPMTRRIVA